MTAIYKVLTLVLLLISTEAFSASLKGYCFNSSVNLNEVVRYVSAISLPKDQLDKRRSVNCIEVTVAPHRDELYQNFLKKRYRFSRIYSGNAGISSSSVVKRNCKIEVLRVGKEDIKGDSYGLKKHGKIKTYESSGTSNTKSQLLLGADKPGRLKVNKEAVYVTCSPRGPNNYELTVSLESSFKESSLATSISVTKGEKVNLGSLVEDINKKKREVSITEGIDYKTEKGKIQFDYYLTIVQ